MDVSLYDYYISAHKGGFGMLQDILGMYRVHCTQWGFSLEAVLKAGKFMGT